MLGRVSSFVGSSFSSLWQIWPLLVCRLSILKPADSLVGVPVYIIYKLCFNILSYLQFTNLISLLSMILLSFNFWDFYTGALFFPGSSFQLFLQIFSWVFSLSSPSYSYNVNIVAFKVVPDEKVPSFFFFFFLSSIFCCAKSI